MNSYGLKLLYVRYVTNIPSSQAATCTVRHKTYCHSKRLHVRYATKHTVIASSYMHAMPQTHCLKHITSAPVRDCWYCQTLNRTLELKWSVFFIFFFHVTITSGSYILFFVARQKEIVQINCSWQNGRVVFLNFFFTYNSRHNCGETVEHIAF